MKNNLELDFDFLYDGLELFMYSKNGTVEELHITDIFEYVESKYNSKDVFCINIERTNINRFIVQRRLNNGRHYNVKFFACNMNNVYNKGRILWNIVSVDQINKTYSKQSNISKLVYVQIFSKKIFDIHCKSYLMGICL